MKVVDSYGWLKVLTATPLGEAYRPAFTSSRELLVPSVCALEVARRLLDDVGDAAGTEAVAIMSQARARARPRAGPRCRAYRPGVPAAVPR